MNVFELIKEKLEEEKCTQVTYRDKYAQGWNNGTQNAISIVDEVAQEYNNGWILCSERLPETYDNLLICQSDGYVNVGYCSLNEFRDMNSYLYKDVIAWQPLPAPYKEGGME